ncbi:hypothetical protein Ciccas_002478 [Cichlidogyrus casuarinus]|uniref:Uncharacterized protein n=1 Tax=Cichlidogyrus casuarinus TaxID=1844966 RepID=A0ABD2QH44_9PLAT
MANLPPGHPMHSNLMAQQHAQQMLIKEQQQRYQQQLLAMRQRQLAGPEQPFPPHFQQMPRLTRPVRQPALFQHIDPQMLRQDTPENLQQQLFMRANQQTFQRRTSTTANNWSANSMLEEQLQFVQVMQQPEGVSMEAQLISASPNVTVNGKIDPLFPQTEQFDDRQLESMMRDLMDAAPQQNCQLSGIQSLGEEFSPRMGPMTNNTSVMTSEPTLGSHNSCSSACSSCSAGSFPNQPNANAGSITPKRLPFEGITADANTAEVTTHFESVHSNLSETNSANTPPMYNLGPALEQDFRISPIWKSHSGTPQPAKQVHAMDIAGITEEMKE